MAVDGAEWSTSSPSCLSPEKEPLAPSVKKDSWASTPSECF